jgi:hypothetical protein
MTIESLALSGDRNIARYGSLPSDEAQDLQRQLAALSPLQGIIEQLDTSERYQFLDSAVSVALDGTESLDDLYPAVQAETVTAALSWGIHDSITWGVDWNEVLKIGNSHFDQAVRAARLANARQRKAACQRLDARPENVCLQLSVHGGKARSMLANPEHRTELMAHLLLHQLGSSFEGTTSLHYLIASERQLTSLCFALQAYHADHGRYPQNLHELVPDYMAAIPQDPLTDMTYTYRSCGDGCLLYGWGTNFFDDQGHEHRDVAARLGNSGTLAPGPAQK